MREATVLSEIGSAAFQAEGRKQAAGLGLYPIIENKFFPVALDEDGGRLFALGGQNKIGEPGLHGWKKPSFCAVGFVEHFYVQLFIPEIHSAECGIFVTLPAGPGCIGMTTGDANGCCGDGYL